LAADRLDLCFSARIVKESRSLIFVGKPTVRVPSQSGIQGAIQFHGSSSSSRLIG
jgi:hypothetical protein